MMGFMVTVHRIGKIRFVIFPNDHTPPHVHVFIAESAAKIRLDDALIEWTADIGKADLRTIQQEVRNLKDHLLAEWRRIHG